MNFRQFALNNVKRDARVYAGHFLSCSFSVMIFFIYAMVMFHPQLSQLNLGEGTYEGVFAVECVIYGFSILFLLYSMSVFLKARNKEFGILRMLGATRSQVIYLILLENMVIGIGSILIGVVCGLATSKLFLMIGAVVLEEKELPFYLPMKAIAFTFILFTSLFSALSFVTVWFIRKNKIIQLLLGTKKPKSELRANGWLVLLSACCFVASIGCMQLNKLEPQVIILILLLGCTGTYFFYTQLSMWMIQKLKKKKSFLWRGTRLLWVSDMAYKLKDNSRMLFIITIVSAMAFSTIGVILATEYKARIIYQKTPLSIEVKDYDNEKEKAIKRTKKIDKILIGENVKYKKSIIDSISCNFKGATFGLEIIPLSDYRSLRGELHLKDFLVRNDEVILINSTLIRPIQNIENGVTLSRGKLKLRVKRQMNQHVFTSNNRLAIVSDQTYAQVKSSKSKDDYQETYISYLIPMWKNNERPSNLEKKVSKKIEKLNGFTESFSINNLRAVQYLYKEKDNRIIIFIGIFMSLILSLSIVGFLYFKLFTDFYQERQSYRKLSKIGIRVGEMNRISSLKIAVMLFFPYIFAALESLISLLIMKKHFGFIDIALPTLYGITAFFILQVAYFFIIRRQYINKMNKAFL
ncbi:putative ABC transport system permease protein [Marininema mesophilum]|uniref:Putative ABC transport system permease protein n=1 Tax=Marininema mesophilum TaxID=1048340 RepID=A0A1H2Z5I9_9BACL|nr:ABC transporter permease [Marininema mesophilum]SDX12059.1 putative ABC transport system permease protein [Marininema mesophilum]